MIMFVSFKYRRECSYHIEFESNNKIKYNCKLFFKNAFNLLDLTGHVLIVIYCVVFINDKEMAEPMLEKTNELGEKEI